MRMRSTSALLKTLRGGFLFLVYVLVGQAAAQTWSPTGSMSTARQTHSATLLSDGRVLVTGGDGDFVRLASTEIYDPGLGTWSVTGAMNTARSYTRLPLCPTGGCSSSAAKATLTLLAPSSSIPRWAVGLLRGQ